MENSPLSDRSVAEEEEAFLDSGARDERYSPAPASPARAATRTRPRGGRTQAPSWMRVGAVDWGIRIAVVGLVIGGFFAVYVNGVAEGWWHAWGETPTVAATGPTAQPAPTPTVSSEAAMSGGYQIGPDGVLVRPAEFAADTYTKPELPETAKENTERGAEAAAEHFHALMGYAWNTGDIMPIQELSDPSSEFSSSYVRDVSNLYANGWAYGSSSEIVHVLKVEPIAANGRDIPPNTIIVAFQIKSTDGTICRGQKVHSNDKEYESTLVLFMTWTGERWVETQGTVQPNDK